MAGTLTDTYRKEMRKANPEPVVLVRFDFTSPSSTSFTITNAHDRITYSDQDVIPILMSVTSVSEKIDPVKRHFQIGSMQIEMLNDVYIRTLIGSHHWFNATVTIRVGTEACADADFATLYSGEVRKVYADYDRIIVDCETRNSKMYSHSSFTTYVSKHPAEVLKLAMNEAGIADSAINTASFAANFVSKYSHYCFSSYGVAPLFRNSDGSIARYQNSPFGEDSDYAKVGYSDAFNSQSSTGINVVRVQAEKFAHEYCEMTGLVLQNDTSSQVKLTFPDPTASVTRHLTIDDYSNFEQDPDTLIFNKVTVECGGGQNGISFDLQDSTSISKFGKKEYKTTTIYFAPAANIPDSEITSTTAKPSGPGVNGFCGTRNLKAGTQTSADTLDSNHPFFGYYRSGIYTTQTAHTDGLSSRSANEWLIDEGHEADGFFRGVFQLSITGLTLLGGESFSNAHARYYYDITIPYQFAQRILERFSNGAPKIKFTLGLEHMDLELGDTISIDNDWFVNPFLGLDGLDSNTKFEITKKEVRPVGGDIGIDFEAVFLITATSPTVTIATNHPGDLERLPIGPNFALTSDINATSTNSVVEGLRVAATSGLGYAIGDGVMLCGGAARLMSDDSPAFTATANKHTYVGFDSSSGAIIVSEVATSDPEPALGLNEIRLAKVISDASSVTSVEDVRRFGATSIKQIDKEALKPGLTAFWNPGFEIWPDTGEICPGWLVGTGTVGTDIIREDSTTYEGERSLRLANTSANATVKSEQIPVQSGRPYRASVWIRQTASFTVNAKLYWYKKDRTASSTASSNINVSSLNATNTWEQKTLTVSAPSDAVFCELQLNRSASPGGSCFFDSVSFREEPYAFFAKAPATTTLTKAVESQVDFQSTVYDFGGGYTAGSSYEYEAPEAGLYQFEASLTVDGTIVHTAHSLKLILKHTDQAGSVSTVLTAYGTAYASTGMYVYGQVAHQMRQGEKMTVHVNPALNSPVLQNGNDESFFSGRRVSQ